MQEFFRRMVRIHGVAISLYSSMCRAQTRVEFPFPPEFGSLGNRTAVALFNMCLKVTFLTNKKTLHVPTV
eukprot:2395680-Rhodomonas_salina.3